MSREEHRETNRIVSVGRNALWGWPRGFGNVATGKRDWIPGLFRGVESEPTICNDWRDWRPHAFVLAIATFLAGARNDDTSGPPEQAH